MAAIGWSGLPLEDGLPPIGLAGGGRMEGLHLGALLCHRIWANMNGEHFVVKIIKDKNAMKYT